MKNPSIKFHGNLSGSRSWYMRTDGRTNGFDGLLALFATMRMRPDAKLYRQARLCLSALACLNITCCCICENKFTNGSFSEQMTLIFFKPCRVLTPNFDSCWGMSLIFCILEFRSSYLCCSDRFTGALVICALSCLFRNSVSDWATGASCHVLANSLITDYPVIWPSKHPTCRTRVSVRAYLIL